MLWLLVFSILVHSSFLVIWPKPSPFLFNLILIPLNILLVLVAHLTNIIFIMLSIFALTQSVFLSHVMCLHHCPLFHKVIHDEYITSSVALGSMLYMPASVLIDVICHRCATDYLEKHSPIQYHVHLSVEPVYACVCVSVWAFITTHLLQFY